MQLYQAELAAQTHRFSNAVLQDYPVLISRLLEVKKACARANVLANEIDKKQGQAIAEACDDLLADNQSAFFHIDPLQGGGGIAINMAINESIFERCQANGSLTDRKQAKEVVNKSQSTADVLYTALSLSLYTHLGFLESTLDLLHSSLDKKILDFADVPIQARTCLQRASMAMVDQLFQGYACAVQRRLERIRSIRDSFLQVNLGGTVLGQGDGASPEYRRFVIDQLRDVTGLDVSLARNLYDCAQNFDHWAAVSQEFDLLAGSCLKVAKDVRMLAMEEDNPLGFIAVPMVIEGSSFYGSKNNPTIAETLIQACFMVKGKSETVRMALDHAELQLNVFAPFMGLELVHQTQFLTKAIDNFTRHLVEGMTIYASKRLKESLDVATTERKKVD